MSENSVESVKVRREPRFTVGWTVRVQTKGVDEVHTLQTMNLSRSGAFIFTPHQVPAGTLLQLTFAIPEEGEFVVFGEVVRVVDTVEADARQVESGMGVAFMNPRKSVRDILDRILRGIELRTEEAALDSAAATWSSLDIASANLQAAAAAAAAAKAGTTDPGNSEIDFERAQQLHNTGEYEGGLEISRSLIERFPGENRYRVLFHLGSAAVLRAQNENDKAVIHWDAAVKLDPENAEAVTALREAGVTKKQQESLVSKLLTRLRGG
jgi:tetratricopeptide (TPR) repeat protein